MRLKQRGVSLVTAIFILVILGLLASYMVRLSASQRITTFYTLQAARAYQAARAGVEWSIAKISADSNCTAVHNKSLSFSGLDGFTVTLACNLQTFSEVSSLGFFIVTATSVYGSYGSADHAYRELQVTLVQ